jgi:hypothetical protein
MELGLDQWKVMERIGDERTLAMATRMAGDLLAAAQDHGSSTKPFTTTSWKP